MGARALPGGWAGSRTRLTVRTGDRGERRGRKGEGGQEEECGGADM